MSWRQLNIRENLKLLKINQKKKQGLRKQITKTENRPNCLKTQRMWQICSHNSPKFAIHKKKLIAGNIHFNQIEVSICFQWNPQPPLVRWPCDPRASTSALTHLTKLLLDLGFHFFFTLPRDMPSSEPLPIQVVNRNPSYSLKCMLLLTSKLSAKKLSFYLSFLQLKFSTANINISLILLGYKVICG